MLLLHGGPNAHRCGLLVLQHVSEASDVGGKRRRSKEGDGKREEEEGGFHISSFLVMDAPRWLGSHLTFSTLFLSQSQRFTVKPVRMKLRKEISLEMLTGRFRLASAAHT